VQVEDKELRLARQLGDLTRDVVDAGKAQGAGELDDPDVLFVVSPTS
jgi:hypothetical protein